jgi:photosystem II stability/assembly factor-like uncharacterized protein
MRLAFGLVVMCAASSCDGLIDPLLDAGTLVDAPPAQLDAGQPLDAGMGVDAGSAPDGGPKRDAGTPPKPDAGPHIVGKCDSLAAIDKWEEITPPGTDVTSPDAYGVTNIAIDPLHAGTLYAGTDHNGIHKTTDCGATWKKVNTGRNGPGLDLGLNWALTLDPNNPDVLYAYASYSPNCAIFKSINGGVDWDSLSPPGSPIYEAVQYNFFQGIALDPEDSTHFIVTFHAPCKDPTKTDPSRPYDSMCMAETTDSGATFRVIKVTLPGFTGTYIEGAAPFMYGGAKWALATWQDGIFHTSDSGGSWVRVDQGASNSRYRTAAGGYYTGSDFGIKRSSADGRTWSLIPNSPNGFGIIGDGKRLFTSVRYAAGYQNQPYFTSLESDGNTWVPFPSPPMSHGAVAFAYDPDHHVLYSANTHSGLWRMVTQ